jgi:hypothetical protein
MMQNANVRKIQKRSSLGETVINVKLVYTSVLLGFFLITTGCVKLSGSITHLLAAPDFKKSEMIVGNMAIANGSDQLLVYIRLLNSDGSAIPDYRPEYDITSGSAILPSQCFTSDKNGLSICVLKSLTAGTRLMKINNVTAVNLEKEIKFLPIPLNNNRLQIVSGSIQNGTAGPYKVKGTIGNITSPMKQAAGPYVVYLSVQGSLTAQPTSSH